MSFPYYIPKALRRKVSARWHAAKAAKRMARGADADTLRKRALDDARGEILRMGCTYGAAGEQHWDVRRSVAGRTDQRDVVVNGVLFKTCGPRRLPAWLR